MLVEDENNFTCNWFHYVTFKDKKKTKYFDFFYLILKF